MPDSAYTYVVTGAARYPGATRDERYGVTTYATKTGKLPKGLEGRTPAPHTWERFIQRLLNDEAPEPSTGTPIVLRPHQAPITTAITTAYRDHRPGYVLSYPTGSGKTYMAVAAVNEAQPTRVLVIAPLSFTAEWRRVISAHATGPTEWIVTNPDRLIHLFVTVDDTTELHAVPADDRVPTALAHGAPLTDFDVVITDEAQILAHTDTDRYQLWQRIVGWSETGAAPRAFTINLSATAWSRPQETAAAAHILAAATGTPVPTAENIDLDYPGWLRTAVGLSLIPNRSGRWRWESNAHDVTRLTHLLYNTGMGATATRQDLGLPHQSRRVHFTHLSLGELAEYEDAWEQFCADRELIAYGITGSGADEDAPYIRAIQKAAAIKAPYVAQLVVDHLAAEHQVVVPAWLSTTVKILQDEINRAATERLTTSPPLGYWAGALTGQTPPEHRASKIQLFQGGYLPVLVTSVTESISLHAGQVGGTFATETNPEGVATAAPRVTVFGDVIHGGKRAFQAEGRAAREQETAEAIYCCAPGTREAEAWAGVFQSLSDTRALGTYGDRVLDDTDIQSFGALRRQINDTLGDRR